MSHSFDCLCDLCEDRKVPDYVKDWVSMLMTPHPRSKPGYVLAFAPPDATCRTAPRQRAWLIPTACPRCGEKVRSWCSTEARRVGWACTASSCAAGDEVTPPRSRWLQAVDVLVAVMGLGGYALGNPGLLGVAIGWILIEGVYFERARGWPRDER